MSNLEASHYNIIKHGKSATFQDAYFFFITQPSGARTHETQAVGKNPTSTGRKVWLWEKKLTLTGRRTYLMVEPLAFWWETSSQPTSTPFFTPTKGGWDSRRSTQVGRGAPTSGKVTRTCRKNSIHKDRFMNSEVTYMVANQLPLCSQDAYLLTFLESFFSSYVWQTQFMLDHLSDLRRKVMIFLQIIL